MLSAISYSDFLAHPMLGAAFVLLAGGAGFALGRRRAVVVAFPVRFVLALAVMVVLATVQASTTLLFAAVTATRPGLWPVVSQVESNVSRFWTCAWNALRMWLAGTRA